MPQLLLGAVFYKIVRNPHTLYLNCISVIACKLKHRTAEPTLDHTIFDSDDLFKILHHFMQHLFVKRIGKPHIIMLYRDTFFAQLLCRFDHEIARVAYTQHCNILSVTYQSCLSYRYLRKRLLPVAYDTRTARIADAERSFYPVS